MLRYFAKALASAVLQASGVCSVVPKSTSGSILELERVFNVALSSAKTRGEGVIRHQS